MAWRHVDLPDAPRVMVLFGDWRLGDGVAQVDFGAAIPEDFVQVDWLEMKP